MTETVDQEVQAIKEVLKALTPPSDKARASVLDYVVKRLDLPSTQIVQGAGSGSAGPAGPAAARHMCQSPMPTRAGRLLRRSAGQT